MASTLKTYMNRLTNLSQRSRSLGLFRLQASGVVDLHFSDYLLGKPSFHLIRSFLEGKENVSLCRELDSLDQGGNTFSHHLKTLLRSSQTCLEETGVNELYMGWPFVEGKLIDGKLVRCPLLFFPMNLLVRKGSWWLELRKNAGVGFNKTFMRAYAVFNQIGLEESFLEHDFELPSETARDFILSLYHLLKDRLEVDFNKESFYEKLRFLPEYTRPQFEKQAQTGRLVLQPCAVLGLFQQGGSYQIPDYLAMLDSGLRLEDLFTEAKIVPSPAAASPSPSPAGEEESRPTAPGSLEGGRRNPGEQDVREVDILAPFDMDSSQEKAFRAIKGGRSVVVQGPPGTGKSQLISNLMADFMARNKKVLLVCQKRVALDVVYERMKSRDLEIFCGLVHDFRGDRRVLFDSLLAQISRLGDYLSRGKELAKSPPEAHARVSSRIEQTDKELRRQRSMLTDASWCGKSVRELYLTTDLESPFIEHSRLGGEFNFYNIESLEKKFRSLFRYRDHFSKKKAMVWLDAGDFSRCTAADYRRIQGTLKSVRSWPTRIGSLPIKKGDPSPVSLFLSLSGYREELLLLQGVLGDSCAAGHFRVLRSLESPQESCWLDDALESLRSCLGSDAGLPLDEPSETLMVQKEIENLQRASPRPWKFVLFHLKKRKKIIRESLRVNRIAQNGQGMRILLRRFRNLDALESLRRRTLDTPWRSVQPEVSSLENLNRWCEGLDKAREAQRALAKISQSQEGWKEGGFGVEELLGNLEGLLKAIDDFDSDLKGLDGRLSAQQIGDLLLKPSLVEVALADLAEEFDNLCAFHRLEKGLDDVSGIILNLLDGLPLDAEGKIRALYNSLGLSWIDRIESEYPFLKAVSTLEFEDTLETFRSDLRGKKDLSTQILISKIWSGLAGSLQGGGNPSGADPFPDMRHQLRKRRTMWPLRRLFREFHEDIFRLVPCWMTSPESASALFPMETTFDLVIFDEASQCFAERGIPVMYRGKQTVVLGDHKQLRPYDLFSTKWNENKEEPEAETKAETRAEAESLLELSERFLPGVMLRGHYRSRALELIEFSNQHFYDGKLQIIPDREIFNRPEPSLRFHKVEGIWENHRNEQEGRHVLNMLEEIRSVSTEKTIGVVTFNAPQQEYITDLVEKSTHPFVELSEQLFVKNLENVQGDERDIVIFSTGYSANEAGRVLLRFGPLNLPGGENRLNVAVTRARETVHLVTSIYPRELRIEKTLNRGPVLLKKYLQYALDIQEGRWHASLEGRSASPHPWHLAPKLQELTADMNQADLLANISFADLLVRRDGKCLGVILTDDDFQSSADPRDPYAYSLNTLEARSWPSLRIHSREYWIRKEKVRQKIEDFIFSLS